MTITLRQESATGATTKGSALTYSELDNNFIDLLNASRITVRGDSGTDQTLGSATVNEIFNLAGGSNITTTVSSDSAGETVLTIAASGLLANVVEDTTPQLGGTLDGQANVVKDVKLENYKETIYALSYAATITPDVANGNVQEITLTGNVTFGGFSNAEDGQTMTLIIHQDGTGSRTFAEGLDSAGRMLFAGGTSTLSTAAGATDVMSILYAGGTYYASLATNFS